MPYELTLADEESIDEEIVAWVRTFLQDAHENECLHRWFMFMSRYERGCSLSASRQYAGLL